MESAFQISPLDIITSDYKKGLKFYLCLKFLTWSGLQQIPFAIIHLILSQTNYSLCFLEPFIGSMNYRTWFKVDFSLGAIIGVWMLIMMKLKLLRKKNKYECQDRQFNRVEGKTLALFFYITLVVYGLVCVLRTLFSVFLSVYWLNGTISFKKCDEKISFIFWLESITTLMALVLSVCRAVYFILILPLSSKIEELQRVDQPQQSLSSNGYENDKKIVKQRKKSTLTANTSSQQIKQSQSLQAISLSQNR